MRLAVTDQDKLKCFDAILFAYLGGPHVIEMLVNYHVDDWSYRHIAEIHGLNHQTAFNYIVKARMKLRAVGLFPKEWEKQEETADA